jgi:hypothetical protein
VVSDWKVGSSITYTGIRNDKEYADKGKIVQMITNTLLFTAYWSSLSNRPDVLENYLTVTYRIEEEKGSTKLTVSQDNDPSKESAMHSERNWKGILDSMKTILEK